MLAHELTHVLQQRNGLQRISRKDYNVGTTASPVNVLIDYSFLETTYFGRFGQGCEDLFARFTGQPVGPVQAAIAALSNTHQRWLLFALDLLIDNPVPGLDKTAAASALIAYAPSARYTPLGGRTDTVFEDEVFRSSGWFERSLTRGLPAPTATEASSLDVLYNGAAASGGSSSACPAARTPLDEPALRNGVRPAFTAFVASQLAILSGATVGTQSISDIRPIADLVQEEAREFFHPYFGRSSTRAFLDQWTYSARIQASTAAGAIPAGMRRAFIDNRAMLKATEAGVIGATHFDSRCAGDIAVWDDIINIRMPIQRYRRMYRDSFPGSRLRNMIMHMRR
ncbi:DUF4157 domain-containing protein [Chitinophaga sedimenti]|nr:DUF4157 domain-containing protein [Chitinophaga sedimenti]